jgi:hypothetical protein
MSVAPIILVHYEEVNEYYCLLNRILPERSDVHVAGELWNGNVFRVFLTMPYKKEERVEPQAQPVEPNTALLVFRV